jgi:glucosamine-6-phosphate deaminase
MLQLLAPESVGTPSLLVFPPCSDGWRSLIALLLTFCSAVDLMCQAVAAKPDVVLGMTTGTTPIAAGFFAGLGAAAQAGRLDVSRVRMVNPDEFIGLAPDHPESYQSYMRKHVFSLLPAFNPDTQWVAANGGAADAEEEARRLEAAVAAIGGVDWQLLGIGRNGHV